MKDAFVQLAERLEGMGNSFACTPEAIAYLKKIFTEEQARIFVVMEDRFQPVEEVAERLGLSPEALKPKLDEMADKGLVMTTTKIEPTFYAPLPWLTGWGDWIAYYEDKETAEAHFKFGGSFIQNISQVTATNWKRNAFRTVPIYETIPNENTIAPYDNIRKVMENAETISVANCYCDLHRKLVGESIIEPLERCFLFGVYAEYLIEKGFGRKVSAEEAIKILDKCRDAGLTHNVTDLKNPIFLCNCPSYCGANILRGKFPLDLFPVNAEVQVNNYCAVVDADLCTGCQDCVGRCNLDAISMSDEGIAQIEDARCVGCGQCVYHCPVEALKLKERPEHYTPITVHPNDRSSEEYKADLERYKDIIKPRKGE